MNTARVYGILAAIALGGVVGIARSEIIVEKDGSVLEGKVIARDARGLSLQVDGSKGQPPVQVAAANLDRVVEIDANGAETAEANGLAKPTKRPEPHWTVPAEPAAPPILPPSKDPTYYVIPLHGPVGETYVADLLDKALADATKRKPTVVVLDINSPGGQVSEAEQMVKTLHQYNKTLRIVALADQDLSASAITSLSVRTIYMKSTGTFGAATAFEENPFIGPQDIQEKFQSAWRAVARNSAEEGGHEPLLAEAMIDNSVELHLETVNGKKVVKEGPGDEMLVKQGKILTLTSHEAVNCGLAAGVADDFNELGAALNFKGWKECAGLGTALADYIPKRREAFEKTGKELSVTFGTNLTAAESAAPSEGMGTNRIVVTGSGAPGSPRIITQHLGGMTPEAMAQWKSRSLTAVVAMQKAEQNIQDEISLATVFGQKGVAEEFKEVQTSIADARMRLYMDRNKYADSPQDTSPIVTGLGRPPQVVMDNPGAPAIRTTPRVPTLPNRPQPPGGTGAPGASGAPAPILKLSNAPLPIKLANAASLAVVKGTFSVGKMLIPPTSQNPADQDVAKDGGVLIGLRCRVGSFANKDVLTFVQPIFLTAQGVVVGPGRGGSPNAGTLVDLVARDGYAVGGATISARPYVDGLRLRFVRLADGRLNPADGYDSATIGQVDDAPASAGSMMPVIGIVSRWTGAVMHLGLVTMTPDPKPLSAGAPRDAGAPLAAPFAALVKDAAAHKTYPSSQYLGNGQKPDFEDFAPDGGLLVGLRYGRKVLPAGFSVVVSAQPVFWTSKGQVLGQVHGDSTVAPTEEIKAPAGYAVAGCNYGGGTFLEYLELTYMKIGDRILLPNDAYRSDRVGALKAGNIDVSTTFGGDGTPVIGLSGSYQTNRLKLGLIYLSPTDAATATSKTTAPSSSAGAP